jgi:predicted Zn-dependent protease
MEDLAARLSRRVHVPCRVDGELRIDPPLLPDREQGDADALLAHLEGPAAVPRVVTVAVAALDLGIPIFTFVFGRARQGGTAALVSLARLVPTFYVLEDVKLVV